MSATGCSELHPIGPQSSSAVGACEKRMVTASLKVSPERRRYLRIRAKQESISVSEFLNRLVEEDAARQGLHCRPASDPAVSDLAELLSEIPEAIADAFLDKLERARLARVTVRTAHHLVNEEEKAS